MKQAAESHMMNLTKSTLFTWQITSTVPMLCNLDSCAACGSTNAPMLHQFGWTLKIAHFSQWVIVPNFAVLMQ